MRCKNETSSNGIILTNIIFECLYVLRRGKMCVDPNTVELFNFGSGQSKCDSLLQEGDLRYEIFEIQLRFVNDVRKFMRSYQDLVHSINAPTVQGKK